MKIGARGEHEVEGGKGAATGWQRRRLQPGKRMRKGGICRLEERVEIVGMVGRERWRWLQLMKDELG
ncbi:hypothetical protein AMTR_s00192p00033290 [Amborella trichopoda]|uniref:Uncharacterized protein n=1 Tax=Amborella trichopoda TaxID=13333 RepID=U5DAN1_AMBTC|nr:hypothetical protein AMTR_s00192p00033290 [Amborella trichopoda]